MTRENQPTEAGRGDYRAISATAVASVVFGLLSAATVLDHLLAVVPLGGIALGVTALRRIRRRPEVLTGQGLARAGLGLSIGFWVLGYGYLTFAWHQEVPTGYEPIYHETLQPDRSVPSEGVPPEIYRLEGKNVYVKGYILPGRQQTGLKRFILCPELPNCPFCNPDPRPTEMILVTFQGDLVVDYTTHKIGVGGKLHVEPMGEIPYHMEADYLH